ncbi:MAG: sigma-70 family RNA polymerase sigma factor [Candidatus Poribacteria bacterium]|nr:sigma-70 family RNA polymerase sigma factor [Candidatus Poribacteria bacterium]
MPDKDENSSNEALMALIDEHKPLLRSIIQLEVQNPVDADDVFQETVLAILEHFRAGKPVENPRAWMVQIAKNRCVDFHRQQRRDRIRDSDLAAFITSGAFGGGVSIADDQHQAVVVKEIRDVIAKMKSIYSDVGKLYIKGHTTREISELLEIPEGTVKSRLRKFRQLIREYLEKDTLTEKKKS